MRNVIALTLIIVFSSWILPLGVFISPAKEKFFCDGQRAICLCSHQSSLKINTDSGKMIGKANSSASHEESSSFSSGFNHISDEMMNFRIADARNYFTRQKQLYCLLLIQSIEHIPKV